MQLITDLDYKKKDYTDNPLTKAEYDNCTFTGCNFENANLSGIVFSQCTFISCNMGNAQIGGSAFKECEFKECKLLGLNFSGCDPFLFSVSFDHCPMDLASFYKMKLKGTKFIHCDLSEADFTEADLTGACFDHCNLENAVFDRTVLEKADLRSAYNFAICPESNRIKKARFSRDNIEGLLHKYKIDIE
ncbi:pentapeptide repeat-containing protein [Flavobacterium sp. RHBU_3]|uniref:pentapeptide repeat-containing protein n=1 Tax=Flavobacterium sp. RHBU_3 TaxID=3391184 RepID=UPI0039854264